MNILDSLITYHFQDKIRYGSKDDGGYVIADLKDKYDCYISAGISNEESFSRDFIKKHGMTAENSFAFDGTIADYPYSYTSDITFFKKNIQNFTNANNTNLDFLFDKYTAIFLKMDIEGGEYPWLLTLSLEKLKKIKQIVIELHGIMDNSYGWCQQDKIECLQKLSETHYLVHAHGNNWASVIDGIPNVIELTYANKEYFSTPPQLNKTPFPLANLDYSNKPGARDIPLNMFPFVHNYTLQEIPKVIYFCNKTLEGMEIQSNKWKELNPEYKMQLYDDEKCREFLLNEYGELYKKVFDFLKDGPIKADFWRVCILYKYGGVYSDIDNSPLVSISKFIEPNVDFLTCTTFMHKYNFNYNPNFIICAANNEILKKCIDWYLDKYNKNQYGYWELSIMCAFTELLHLENFNKFNYGVYYYNNMKIQILKECAGNNPYDSHNIYNNLRIFNNRDISWDYTTHSFKSS